MGRRRRHFFQIARWGRCSPGLHPRIWHSNVSARSQRRSYCAVRFTAERVVMMLFSMSLYRNLHVASVYEVLALGTDSSSVLDSARILCFPFWIRVCPLG